ncbi:endoglycosylceramidase [Entomortierella parvispora]|uniref:Endoglycosylceramidase n=1 Tax=Entomortierella parvispora TaxID=205924 RepID=A0A9P3HL07_9FUNG|nr:endoglycosylceramidase [Entomortierella parvispora]
MRFLSISAAVLASVALVTADLSKIVRVDPASQQFIDANGRSRFFHGTNMIKKVPPYHADINQFDPGYSLVDRDIQVLKDLNINSIRLGVQWTGVEPVRGQYNQTYLDITGTIIQRLQDNGIYALLDQHQDVWAPQLCGEGAPDWFVQPGWVIPSDMMPVPQQSTPFAVDANGMPSAADCDSIDWSTSYLDYAVGNAFGRLYNNYDSLGDAWALYWKTVVTNYHMLPGVLGYDLMNEPWVGDHMADPTLLIPGRADSVNLEPLWNKGTAQIRTVDNTTIVFFEGVTFDILSGFENVPGGDGTHTAQSYHYYKPPQLGSVETTIQNRITDATRLKTTGMMTEFQFWGSDNATLALILEAAQMADTYMQSWQGWSYEELWSGDNYSLPLAQIYARTYAEATAGVAKTLYFQDTTAKYWVSWIADTSITAPGLIRIAPNTYYPDGIRVFFVPAGTGTYTMENENVVQLHYTSTAVTGQTIQASVQPYFPTDIIKSSASTGFCMDNSNAFVNPNNPIIIWGCSSSANQVWKFKNGTISLAFDPSHNHDTFCLDTQPIASKTYFSAVLNPCQAGSQTQQWSVNAAGNIINASNGYCLDITGSTYKAGTDVITYPCSGNPNQEWILPRGASGTW